MAADSVIALLWFIHGLCFVQHSSARCASRCAVYGVQSSTIYPGSILGCIHPRIASFLVETLECNRRTNAAGINPSEPLPAKGDHITSKVPHGEEVFTLFLPQPALDLGTPPRLCYPLVIFLIRNEGHTMHPDETVALVNVVHIKDSVCTLPTSILAQYLKQANGQLSCLKQLYLATGNPLNYEDEPALSLSVRENNTGENGRTSRGGSTTLLCTATSDEDSGSVWNAAGEQLCVVCQYFPLSRALLPCRHTCICASCFGKLDRCPMCRSPIRSYFCIRGEEYMPVEPGSSASKPPPILRWFQDWNDRLTDFLGFHR